MKIPHELIKKSNSSFLARIEDEEAADVIAEKAPGHKGWLGWMKNSLEKQIIGGKAKAAHPQRSQVLPDPIQPLIEQTPGQPSDKPVSLQSSKDIGSLEHADSTDSRKRSRTEAKDTLTSRKSSISSWSSEPVPCGIDSTTGHLILSYMEGYLQDAKKLDADWDAANTYEAEEATPCSDAELERNLMKNRLGVPLPYEQSRVRLRSVQNDYINASLLYDHTPRNPIYIATPTPMRETVDDFWIMVWEQNGIVLVNLEQLNELKQANLEGSAEDAVQYWPTEGSQVFGKFEVHLVSEHSWCENYVVRSFYLKKLDTGETRTVTQFHYLTWTDDTLKSNTRQILEFRRKVNRSFRGMMSPIVVHCRDGSSRTGTYILLDLVLNRIAKGVKEINIAATLEHLRDQRQGMVQSKEQYEFVFTAVAQEVDAMLKTTAAGHTT